MLRVTAYVAGYGGVQGAKKQQKPLQKEKDVVVAMECTMVVILQYNNTNQRVLLPYKPWQGPATIRRGIRI